MSRFNRKAANSKITSKRIAEERVGISIDDCARLCIDKIGDECRLFSFCYVSGDCITSTLLLDEYTASEVNGDNFCDIYESNTYVRLIYLFSFIYRTLPKLQILNEYENHGFDFYHSKMSY